MKVLEIRLKNFMKHAEAAFAFDAGVNVIAGPNEAGKSSVLDALELALFGKPSRYDHRRYYVGPEGNSYSVEVTFEEGGAVYSIIHEYDSSKKRSLYRLYKDGELVADRKIHETLAELIGTGQLRSLNSLVYVRQGQLTRFANVPRKERVGWLKRVLGLSGFDAVEDAVGRCYTIARKALKEAGGDKLSELVKEAKTVRKQGADVKVRLEAVNAKCKSLAAEEERVLEALSQLDSKRKAAAKLMEEKGLLNALRERKASLKKAVDRLQDLKTAAVEYEKLSKRVEALRSKAAGLKGELAAFRKEVAKLRKEKERCAALKKALVNKLAENGVEPEQLEVGPSELLSKVKGYIPKAMRKQAALQARVDELRRRVNYLSKHDRCDACGQPIGDAYRKTTLKALKEESVKLESKLKELSTHLSRAEAVLPLLNEYCELTRRMEELEKSVAESEKRAAELEKQLGSVEEQVKESSSKLQELEAAWKEYVGLRGADKEYRSICERISKLQAKLSSAQDAVWTDVDEKRYEELKLRHRKLREERLEFESKRSALQERMQALRERYALIKETVRELKTLEDRMKAVADLRNAFKACRSLYQASIMEVVPGIVNDIVERFGFDFRTELVTENGALDVVLFVPGFDKPRPLSTLSGAQLVVFELALRIAVASAVGNFPGILILDEPTHNLDDVRVKHLADFVRFLVETGLVGQIILITHEKEFMGVADSVVELCA